MDRITAEIYRSIQVIRKKYDITDDRLAEIIRHIAVVQSTEVASRKPDTKIDLVPGYLKETDGDFQELHEHIVDEIIQFVKEHKEPIFRSLNEKREEILNRWTDEEKALMTPDLNLTLSLDCIEESVEFGEWCPTSDSGMSLNIGNTGETIVFNM